MSRRVSGAALASIALVVARASTNVAGRGQWGAKNGEWPIRQYLVVAISGGAYSGELLAFRLGN